LCVQIWAVCREQPMKETVLSAMLSAVDADDAQGYDMISWRLSAETPCARMKLRRMLCSQKVCKKPSDDMHLRQQERTQEKEQRMRTLLLLRPMSEPAVPEATVVAHVRGVAGGVRVVATATGRENFVITHLRGEVEGVVVVAVSIVIVAIFVALLILGAGVVLAVGIRRGGALRRVAMGASRAVVRISADTRRAPEDVLSGGPHALVEGAGESSDVTTTVT
jgi:hypothetical protein